MGSLGAMGERHGSAVRYFQDRPPSSKSWCRKAWRGAFPTRGAWSPSCVSCRADCGRHGYTGSRNITDMRTRPGVVRITTAGIRESHVHDVSITKEAPNYRVS